MSWESWGHEDSCCYEEVYGYKGGWGMNSVEVNFLFSKIAEHPQRTELELYLP